MLISLGGNDQKEINEVHSITQCIFCEKNLTAKEEISSSKLLPCLHAACSACLNDCFDKDANKCSSCLLPFSKDDLYDNKVLYEIVSDFDLTKIINSKCSIHNAAVTNWCQDCDEFICEFCVKSHGQLKSTIAHSIVSKDNKFVRLLASTPKNVFPCEVHPKNNLTISCHTCNAMTCRDCQLEEHRDHDYDFIKNEIDGTKIEVYNFLKAIEYNGLILNAALGKSEDRKNKLNEIKKSLISDIKKEFDKVRKVLDKREKELMLNAIAKVNVKLEEYKSSQSSLVDNLSLINRCIEFVKCVIFTSSDSVIFYTKDLMLNFMKNINLHNRIPCTFDLVNVVFNPHLMDTIIKNISVCGTINENVNNSLLEKMDTNALYNEVCKEWLARKKFIQSYQQTQCACQTLESYPQQASCDCTLKNNNCIVIEDEEWNGTDKQIHSTNELPCTREVQTIETVLPTGVYNGGHCSQRSTFTRPGVIQESFRPIENFAQSILDELTETSSLHLRPQTVELANGRPENTMFSFEILRPGGHQLLLPRHALASPLVVTNENWCSVCLCPGSLVFCTNCPKGFHRECHIPVITSSDIWKWRCILCEEISPLPRATYHYFRPDERRVADRLLLEMFCQVEASLPFRNPQGRRGGARGFNPSLVEIKSNLANGKYISILKFIADIRALLVNCFRLRQDEPHVIAHAKTLEEIFNRLLSKFIPHLNACSA